MEERFAESAHGFQGPHWSVEDELPEQFVPLRLEIHGSEPGAETRVVELSRPVVVVGRHSEADLVLGFPEVSRRHCRLAFRDGCWHIADLNSLNGLFLNSERIHEAVIHDGDCLRIGAASLIVLSCRTVRSHPWAGVLRSIAGSLEAPAEN